MDTDPILKFLYLLSFAAIFLICWGLYLCWLFDKKTYNNRRTARDLELSNIGSQPSGRYGPQQWDHLETGVNGISLSRSSSRHSGSRTNQNQSHRNSLGSHSHRSSIASPRRLSPVVGPVHLSPFHGAHNNDNNEDGVSSYSSLSRRASEVVGLAEIRLDDLPNYDAVSEVDESPPSYSECILVPPSYSVSLSPSPVLGGKY